MSRLDPGARLGADLVLLRLLGAGGLGEAWLARHRTRGTVVAKVLPSAASPDGPALLERECRLAMALDHPAIVPVFGCEHDGDWAWLIQAHVRGGDARQLRGQGAGVILRAMLPVVDALEHAHARGVVHRDVKASNVLLDQHGNGRLADFGLAATLTGGPEVAPLAGGGTPGSMSPQQLEGAPPHPADDVYGFGILLHDLVQGSPLPPALAELLSTMVAARQGDRPDLSAVREGLLSGLAALPAEPELPSRPRREVVLAPPPRIEAVISPAALSSTVGRVPSPNTVGGRRSSALPVAVLGALMLVAVGVFVFLPRWVTGRAAPPPSPVGQKAAAPEAPASPKVARDEAEPGAAAGGAEAGPRRAAEAASLVARPADQDAAPRAHARTRESAPRLGETEAAWSQAVSEGLRALDHGAFAEARTAFTRAESVRGGTPEVADGLARADQGLRAEALAGYRSQGEAAEAREDWTRAVAEYGGALKLEPAVAFALAGRARSAARAELDEQLEGYVRQADRLSAEAVAREAEAAVARAREVHPAGPRLSRQIAAVEQLLVEFRAPVAVRLLSDGLTDVVVLRVGRFGTFREKALDLRPGTYVVVGTRPGYRDARRTLSVPRGKSPEPLLVRCDEAL